ncbi:PREDICTED: uncharacterized protein LOC101313174 [Fragaria vesca subsp. vesca]|uniref:uncharacterized protein LOC101313174 n=1 Tax=Fragaria vesca subsp. vesca TaxID=101020 RepID=UPI0002C300D6|nr:PREDICTED: uncharacterized protein LOC101313174 [Fragaria vesca subsp. vesca]
MALFYIFGKSLGSAHPMFSSLLYRNQAFAVAASHFGRRFISSSIIPAAQDNPTLSYLIRSCGLSPKAATLAAHKVQLRSLEQPNSVLALLREYEFSDTQISTLVRRRPQLILANAKKTLLPKLEFFCSIGMSRLDLAKIMTYNPNLLTRSLENSLIPCYNFLKSVVISDVKVVRTLKQNSSIFLENLSKNVKPNIRLVTELGMPHSALARLVACFSKTVTRKPEFFSQLVRQVAEMGFDPGNVNFVQAMVVLSWKKTTWRHKEEAYRRWGWSDNDILSAFKRHPLCMMVSEKKIMVTMDFLVNKMGWESGKIAEVPYVFVYSLEKRIIPRCSVVRVLLLKGLIEEKKLSLSYVFVPSEECFFSRFVTRYLDQVPQLLDVYQGKVYVQDV